MKKIILYSIIIFLIITKTTVFNIQASNKMPNDTLSGEKTFPLNSVSFDANNKLTPASFQELDKVVMKLKNEKNMELKISTYIENMKPEEDSKKITQERAKAIKDYMISKGIIPYRLFAHGSGSEESIPTTISKEKKKKDFVIVTFKKIVDDPNFEKPTTLKSVKFSSGGDTIMSSSEPELLQLTKVMKMKPALIIKVLGHAVTQGSDDIDQRLSEGRASGVKNFLVKNGIDAKRILTEGCGNRKPLATNDTEDGRSKNNRIEIAFKKFK
jgi:outer membrane protein OmpA-like peptidoglycan-associated protein